MLSRGPSHITALIALVVILLTAQNVNADQTSSSLTVIGRVGDACFEDAFCVTKSCISNICASKDSRLEPYSDIVSPNMTTKIYGYNFSSNRPISIQIFDQSSSSVYGPKNFTSDGQGDLSFLWKVNVSPGIYLVKASDPYQDIMRNTTINVSLPYTFDARIFDRDNNTLSSSVYLYLDNGTLIGADDEVFRFNLSYGVKYEIEITPSSAGNCGKVRIKSIFNSGSLQGNFLGLSESGSVTKDSKRFSVLCGINPLVTDYDHILTEISHDPAIRQAVWKCAAWNFTSETCIDRNWIELAQLEDGSTQTNVTLYLGDPGIGIASSCGDDVCSGSESCSNCAADCGSCISLEKVKDTVKRASNFVFADILKQRVDLDKNIQVTVELKPKETFTIIYDKEEYEAFISKRYAHRVQLSIEGKEYGLSEGAFLEADLDNDAFRMGDVMITFINNTYYTSNVRFIRVNLEGFESEKPQSEEGYNKTSSEEKEPAGQEIGEGEKEKPKEILTRVERYYLPSAIILFMIILLYLHMHYSHKDKDGSRQGKKKGSRKR